MNDLIIMAIQGGRYLEAEKQIGNLILNQPTADAYFLLGTTKSNLLLDKGRSYLEVQFCFNRYLELTQDRASSERNIMVFCVGLYSQLSELEKNLLAQKKAETLNVALGTLVTFASSKVIDESSKSFGVISGMLGASFGIGMALDGLSNIGSISDMISYVSRLKVEMVGYLESVIQLEKDLLSSEILTLSEKFGAIASVDKTIDTTLLQTLDSCFIPPKEAIAMISSSPNHAGVPSWRSSGGFLSLEQFEIPKDNKVIGGLIFGVKDGLLELLLTDKGVYHFTTPVKFKPYSELIFKKSVLGQIRINIKPSIASAFGVILGAPRNAQMVVNTLNEFVNQMKSM
jgi:hypothetical protein